MNTDFRIPKFSLSYLLLTQLLLLIPLLRYLPPWILIVWFACGFWHWRVHHQKAKNPKRVVLLSLIVLMMIAEGINFKSNPLGLEPSVTLLIIATSLKMLEIKSNRDVFVVCFMGFLIAPVQFLFDQDMATAAWIFLICLPMLLLTLFSLQSDGQLYVLPQIRSVLKLLAISVPMMIVIFLIFPRFGPLWAVPIPGKETRTGLSNSISPGSFVKLGKSTELAFRVKFKDQVPDASKLYWRAIVFSKLQVDTWKPAEKYWRSDKRFTENAQLNDLAPDIEYEVTIEPNYEHWLYALDVSRLGQASDDVRTSAQLTFYRESPNMSAFAYQGVASTKGYFPFDLSEEERLLNTATNKLFNPKTRELIETWKRESDNSQSIIKKALNLFAEEFSYTLEPPPLGRHSVDEFLFESKLGFCEHYASAFAIMMRMAGIPARLVGGYLGGELNKNGNYLLVYQSDAHAWVEVWIEGQGWTRIDPTSVVSPERISDGIARALNGSEAYLSNSLFSMRKFDLLNELRFWIDELDYDWQRWVIGYRSDRQLEVLTNLLGKVNVERILTFMVICFLGIIATVWLFIFYEHFRHRKAAVDRAYNKFIMQMSKAGFKKEHWQGALAYQNSLSELQPDQINKIKEITDLYLQINYQSNEAKSKKAEFIKKVKEFKL